MSYMQDVDRWLDALLTVLPDEERTGAKQQIKTKLLESYRNGQACPTDGRGASRDDRPKPPAATAAYSGRPPVADRRDNRQPYRRSYRGRR